VAFLYHLTSLSNSTTDFLHNKVEMATPGAAADLRKLSLQVQ